jgi:signal transduction histidine kinase
MSSISISPDRSSGSGPGGLGSTVALALGTFAVGADAFVIAGFLPSVAGALHVSTADGRLSVTVFVVAYAILAPLLAATTARVPRRVLLIAALLVLGLANLVCALAPSLPVLITGRVLAAGGAAAYTPIAAAVCTTLVSPRRRGPALVAIVGGMTVATTLGLSLGELTGRWLGWRTALGTVAALCLLAGAGVLLTLPRLPGAPPRTVAARLPGLPVVLSITVLGVLSGYGVYASFAPAGSTAAIPGGSTALTLFAYGLGAMFVNAVTGLRRAGEERRLIARELHDSLTHNIALIKVQAGIAVHLARQRGEPVPDTLLAIQAARGEAMRELRATLGNLRDTAAEPAVAGLDRLPDLISRARSAGLPSAVTVSGERRTLPADVDRTAYRIVQESLTNIARHAGEASALVQISYSPGALGVRIDDNGRATPDAPPEPGIGLTGMRERVTALGGRLRTGPRHEGGFTVEAELPLREAQPGLPHRHRMPVG